MKKPLILITLLGLMVLIGCGDPAPTEFIPQNVVQGFIIVGEPIRGIQVMKSQSVADTFRYANSGITDANVTLTSNGRVFQLQYRPNSVGEYFYPDTAELVQPNTPYELKVTLADGTVMTGATKTPGQVNWIQAPKDTVQYPHEDSLSVVLPDSMKLLWTAVPGVGEYPISVRCLDTVEYGKYLGSEMPGKNVRIDREIDKNTPDYKDVSRWGFLQGTSSPISWLAFKWYGLHEVSIWAADDNFMKWFKFTLFGSNQQYESRLGSIKGGTGVFASASVARQRVFLLKGRE
jgi:hypothetical protein